MTHCPRCGGSVTIEEDYLGRDAVCINCGWRQPLTGYDADAKPPSRRAGRPHTGRLRGMSPAQRRRRR